ncbi:portal protein [Bradyrhizobium ivorense]|uniref:portal protein n=1 Tax=Bradyrhizobium ivorense TaxID=2511166 RepID=UPI001FCEF2FC|nr:hypothetical protein [Bradyrhizobium ivorense]
MPAPLEGQIFPPAPTFHDVTIRTTRKLAQARVMGVPPEEFGIERGARTIKEANYCFHEVVTKTEAQLIAEGFDKEQVKGLMPYSGNTNTETQQRDTVNEHAFQSSGTNASARYVRVTEHYVRMDYEGNGRPILYQVITGGERGEILRKDGKPCIEPFDAIPFAAGTPIPMTHRFIGRSIADIVMPLQREKTAMKRGALDNLYLSNNPRAEVSEDTAGPNTLDDLLVSRPGGVVRVKKSGTVNWQEVPNNIQAIMPAMQYLESELETRTGLTKQSQGIDANALQNQSATATAQVFSASQARVKLLARILAEGVRDMVSLLHGTIRKHGQQQQTVRLRRQWVDVDPRGWKTRDDMTINVGLGTGGKAQQFAQTMAIGNVQKEMVQAGMTNLVGPTELYNTACELTKIMGHKNPNRFFKDPDAKDPQTGQLLNPPPAPKPDPKTQAIQAQSQATMMEQQQRSQLSQQETQLEAQLSQLKAELDGKLKILSAAIEARTADREHAHAHQRHHLDVAGDVLGIVAHAHAHDTAMAHKHADHQARQQERAEAAADGG